MALEKVAGNVPSGRPPKRSKTVAGTRLTNEEEQALADAMAAGERAALNKEDEEAKASETEDYQIQGTFEGTQKQMRFPVDLSLTILKMQALANNRYKCTVLHGLTKSEFYHYQASGAL